MAFCAGGTCMQTTAWDDLPPELREAVLAKVPLLCLAQSATVCKEFHAAALHRQVAEIATSAWLPHDAIGPGPDHVSNVLSMESFVRSFPRRHQRDRIWAEWRMAKPGGELQLPPPWTGHTYHFSTVHRNFLSLTAPILVSGVFSCWLQARGSGEWVEARAEVQSEVVVGLTRRTTCCKELVLRCNQGPSQQPGTSVCLMLFTAMAAPLRRFLHDVAMGGDLGRRDRKKKKSVGAMQRIMLVLPEGSELPNEADESAICEALSSIVFLVWGRPSGVRLAVATGPTPQSMLN